MLGAQVLTREQLKRITGGTVGSGNGTCKTGSCTVKWVENGVNRSESGHCKTSVSGNSVECYCDAQPAGSVIVDGNGNETKSQCWA